MALNNCKECSKEVSTKAESCPNCGAVLKKKHGGLYYIACFFLLSIIIGSIGTVLDVYTKATSTKPVSGFKMPSLGKQIVTFSEYQEIENDMSYEEVTEIIGSSGEELSRNKINGVPGVMESVETIMYQWVNENGSNMNAMFQNNKLIQKSQFGLK